MKLLVILITMTSSLTRSLHLVNSRRIATSLLKSRGGSTGFHSNLSMMAASTATVVDVTTERLVNLRKVMKDDGMDCIIVPTEDPHMSEYTAPYYYRREFISGFTGSAGTAVITTDKALLFTDGRYHNQAEMELGSEWTLMRQGLKDIPSPAEWIAKTFAAGSTVGIDPLLHGARAVKKIEETLLPKNILIKHIEKNPIDKIWTEKRSPIPNGVLRIHPAEYAGKSVEEKLIDIRAVLADNQAYALVSTSLDEIAWLFNVRGSDVPCNPVSVSYAIVTTDSATLFIDDCKMSDTVGAHLSAAGVQIKPYEEAITYVRDMSGNEKLLNGKKIWCDGKSVNFAMYGSVPIKIRLDKESPITIMKATKNEAELSGMRACHLRDGAAESEFLAWLDQELAYPTGLVLDEVVLDEKVTASRALLSPGMFLEPSFPTIAGVNGNGAIVHYRAVSETCKPVGRNDMILLDSGGQYLDGTTDVTRTFHTGNPTAFQIEMFTRVLKGHIGVASRVFPTGTAGCLLDSYAREHLWAIGKDYIHGTGHGVGAALNVHEGPHSVSRVMNPQPLVPGMVVSNEPGYYETDNFGIRIENLMVVVPMPSMGEFGGRGFLGFEKLTHIPIQKKLIDVSLLTDVEVKWINEYHSEIMRKVGPLMITDLGRKWLIESTNPLVKV